ncbi:MAG: hypothetical protein ACUVTA_06180, partial [Thermodesulfitimonas sp.]
VLRAHPAGLSLNQIVEAVNFWRPATPQAVEGVLRRFPFFLQQGDNWSYSSATQAAYDMVMKRFLDLLRGQKKRHLAEREAWQKRLRELRAQLSEVSAAYQQAAAALAQQARYREQYEDLSAQLSEKELLLMLRKRELVYYRDQIKRLEDKAQSILHQCRLWVSRAREGEKEIMRLNEVIAGLNETIASLKAELNHEKEKERESRTRLAEVRDQYGTQVANLQRELIDLKQKLQQTTARYGENERRLTAENARLSSELQRVLSAGRELERDLPAVAAGTQLPAGRLPAVRTLLQAPSGASGEQAKFVFR